MKNSAYTEYYYKNHNRRLIAWSLLYLILVVVFLIAFLTQIMKVNTLQIPSGYLQIVSQKTKYTVGDTVSFSLLNGYNTPIQLYNKCPKPWLHIYQFKNQVWNQISAIANITQCASEPQSLTIAPHKSITENYSLWPKLFNSPGIYRLVVFASNDPTLAYTDFQVVAKQVILSAPSPVVIYKPVYTPVYTPVYVPTGGGDGGGSSSGQDN